MQRKELRSGRKEGKMFVDEDGVGELHWQRRSGWVRLNSGSIRDGASKKKK